MINTTIFVAFIFGVIAGWYASFNIVILCLLSFICLLFLSFSSRLYRRPYLFVAFLTVFFALLGILWVTPYSLKKPQDFVGKDNFFLIKVTSIPKEGYLKRTFYAQVERVGGFSTSFRVKVNSFSHRKIDYRTSYLVRGRLSAKQFKHNSFYILWLKKDSYIKELPSNWIDNFIRKVTFALVFHFKKYLSPEAYKFSSSVFLGRRELAEWWMSSLLRKAAVAHLFAISGLHVGLISGMLFFTLKIFRIRFRARLIIAVIFMFIFALCAGMRPSIVRASIMFSFLGAGFFLKRKISVFDSLSIAGIVCLLLNPLWVLDVGFQLSFLSVFSIIVGFNLFSVSLGSRSFLINYVKGIFFSTVFVFIAIFPLVSLYFGRVYLLGIAANIILIPIFTFILILIFIFVGLYFVPFLATYAAEVLSLSVSLFLRFAFLMGKIRFAYFTFSMKGVSVFLYYTLLLLGAVLVHRYKFNNDLSV